MTADATEITSDLGPIFPFVQVGPWTVGPFTVHIFGLMVFLGMLVAFLFYWQRARRVHLDPSHVYTVLPWALGSGLLMSHISYFVLSPPDEPAWDILRVVNVFDGMFSFGGFAGVVLGISLYAYRHRVPFLLYADTVLWGSAHGWLVVRLGCTFTHDHPGIFTDSWFSVRWPTHHPDQVYNIENLAGRHDLGLYEAILTAAIILALYATNRRGHRFAGFNGVLFFFLYAPARFFMDSLRVVDARYLGWTSGQYAAVVFFVLSLGFLIYHLVTAPAGNGRPRTPVRWMASNRNDGT